MSSDPPEARMTEFTTEPRTNSVSRLRWVAPRTNWVAFSALATRNQGQHQLGTSDYLDIAAAKLIEQGAVLDQALGGRGGEAVLGQRT